MLIPDPVVFLFDVDNTLIDNDRFAADLSARLAQDFGAGGHGWTAGRADRPAIT